MRLTSKLLLVVLFLPLVTCFSPSTVFRHEIHTILQLSNAAVPKEEKELDDKSLFSKSRRKVAVFLSSAAALLSSPLLATANVAETNSNALINLLSRLRRVPTFCIVNSQGIPYMAVNVEQRMAKGYAFTSFEAALAVLADAQRAAEQGGYSELWKDATITVISADVAMRLALQKRKRSSQKENQSLDSVMELIPSANDREDGLKIDKFAFRDQGHVPLFYVAGLPSQDGDNSTLMYFQKAALLSEWNHQFPGTSSPEIKVLDLVYVFEATLRGYTDKFPRNMVFVPPEEALSAVKELKSRGTVTPYKLDEMII